MRKLKNFGIIYEIVYIFQKGIDKIRPNKGKWSFPSGNIAAVFYATACFHYKYELRWTILVYLLIPFIGYSQLIAKKHYVNDMFWETFLTVGTTLFPLLNIVLVKNLKF